MIDAIIAGWGVPVQLPGEPDPECSGPYLSITGITQKNPATYVVVGTRHGGEFPVTMTINVARKDSQWEIITMGGKLPATGRKERRSLGQFILEQVDSLLP